MTANRIINAVRRLSTVAPRISRPALVLLGVAACVDNGPRLVESGSATVADVIENPQLRSMSPEEHQIVDSLASMFPEAARQVRALLTDRRVALMELPGDHAMALLARLDSIRAYRAPVSYIKAESQPVVPATVVLVDELDDPTAVVIVVRRSRPAADMIVMSEKKARGALLGAGIAALFKLRKQFGDSATRDMHLVVRNARMPKKWPTALKHETDRLVAQLRKSERKAVRGFGQSRSAEVSLVRTAR